MSLIRVQPDRTTERITLTLEFTAPAGERGVNVEKALRRSGKWEKALKALAVQGYEWTGERPTLYGPFDVVEAARDDGASDHAYEHDPERRNTEAWKIQAAFRYTKPRRSLRLPGGVRWSQRQ